MSEEPKQEIIIVRRRSDGEEGHHGGAWKIAYADFVTAMMAFFMVLWILAANNKDSQTVIARYFNPVKMEDFAKNKKGIREQEKEEKPGSNQGEPDKAPPVGQDHGANQQKGKEPNKDINAKSLMNEETLFQNPYAALEQIAGRAPAPATKTGGSTAGESGSADAFHDPFRPTGGDPADDDTEDEAGSEQQPAAQEAPPPSKAGKADKTDPARAAQAAAVAAEAEKAAVGTAQAAAGTAQAAADKAEATALQKDIARAAKAQGVDGAPQFEVKTTDEGLLISLTDNEKFGMFEVGSSQPNPKLVHLMDRIAQKLKDQKGAIVLRGYTDSRPYRNGTSDNWRLSASRAQMAFFMLVRGGLPEARLEKIEAFADRKPKAPEKPEAAENRRIEILLRRSAS